MINTKTKSALIIAVTLIIGIAIGFEISEIFVKRYMDQMRKPREPQGFQEMYEKIIKPDAAQKAQLDSILIRYHARIKAISDNNRLRIRSLVDSMHTELKSRLNPEQKSRLDEEFERMKKFAPPGDRGGFPPPPGREGPPPEGYRPPPGDMPPPMGK